MIELLHDLGLPFYVYVAIVIFIILAETTSKSDLSGKLSLSNLSLSDKDVNRPTTIVSKVNVTLQKQLELRNVHTSQLQVYTIYTMKYTL